MGRASILQSVQWRMADESRMAWAALPYSSRSNGARLTSQGRRGPRFHTPVGPMAHGRRVKDGVGRASILQSVQWRTADESRMAWAALPYSSRSNGAWPTSQGWRGPRFHTPVGPMAHGRRVKDGMGRASILQSVQWRMADESRMAWAALPYSSRSNDTWPTSQGRRGPRFHTPVGPMAHGRRVNSRMAWATSPRRS